MGSLKRVTVAVLVVSFSAFALTACSDPVGYGDNVQLGLSLSERDLQPGRAEVKAGEVEFLVKNDGQRPHAFAVEGPEGAERTKTIAPGETVRLKVELSEGSYQMYDPSGNFRARGVSGTVAVSAGTD